jgi:hypothetical protein
MIKSGNLVITNNQKLGKIIVKVRTVYSGTEDEKIFDYDYPEGENKIGWDYCKNAEVII